ncbi:hypothetical protein FB446DRAFT_801899 [Lentinula raphanica]|nr:hypothetical protein FB446DRAFT_801899 [Lentinula raphanica]
MMHLVSPIHSSRSKFVAFSDYWAKDDEFGYSGSGIHRSLREDVLERMPPPELKATVMGVVSKTKPAGSSSGGDLSGNDAIASPVPKGQSNGNQDLLADIFGSSGSTLTPRSSTGAISPPQKFPKSQQSTIDDILGLFGNTPFTTAATTLTPPANFMAASSPPCRRPCGGTYATRSTATHIIHCVRRELKITLTLRASPAKPGVVVITLARFQVSGGTPATGLTFQAAVPKEADVFDPCGHMFCFSLPMSNPDVGPGSVETQQMRVIAPVGCVYVPGYRLTGGA